MSTKQIHIELERLENPTLQQKLHKLFSNPWNFFLRANAREIGRLRQPIAALENPVMAAAAQSAEDMNADIQKQAVGFD
jgi:hypothetical protein